MKVIEKIREYPLFLKAFFLDAIIIAVATLGMIPCFLTGWQEIPQGLLLGGLYGALMLFITHLVNIHEEKNQKMKGAIIIITVRVVILALILLGFGYLYYQKGFKAFNLFSIVGGYLISTLSVIIVSLIDKKEKEASNV